MCKRNIRWLPLARPQPGTWSATQACAQTRKWTRDLSVRGKLLNTLGHTSQGWTILYPHRWTFPPWNTMTQTLWGTKGELLVDLLSHAGHVFLFLEKQLSTCISRLSLPTITRGKIFNCSYPITPRRETPRRAEIAQLYSQHLDWCLTRSRCRTRMTEWMSEKLKSAFPKPQESYWQWIESCPPQKRCLCPEPEIVTLFGKTVFTDIIKLRILRWDILNYPGGL